MEPRPERTLPGAPRRRERSLVAIYLVMVILLLYIGSLVVNSYLSQVELRRQNRVNLVQEAEKRATALAYFLAERRNDVSGLLQGPGLRSFFENRALGMSLEYGLGFSLDAARREFADLLDTRRLGDEPIYSAVAFIDPDGVLLIDAPGTSAMAELRAEPAGDWRPWVDPELRQPTFLGSDAGAGQDDLLISAASYFKGAHSGQLLVWLRAAVVDRLLRDPVPERTALLLLPDGRVYAGGGGASGLKAYAQRLADVPVAEPVNLAVDTAVGAPQHRVVVRVAVPESDFSLVLAVPRRSLMGRDEPWEFLAAMCILALVIVVGAALILRAKIQTMVLGARLDEAAAQRLELEEKNRLLEREVAERRLLITAVEQSAEAIVVTLPDGTIQYVNPAFEKITGYGRAEALGQTPAVLKSGRHDAAFYAQLWDVIHRGGVWTGRFTNRRKDGTLYEEDATISPVRDAAGRIVNYVAVKRDVSQHVAMEERLRQSQKMEAVGELAGGIAHDFNNLVTVILGNCNLILGSDHGLPAPLREHTLEVQQAAERAVALTRQLLTFSRRQKIRPETLDVGGVVQHAESLLRRLIRENIRFEISRPAVPLFIRADPVQIDQILINLTVNARDAMPAGGTLRIAAAPLIVDPATDGLMVAGGDYAVLTVSDTGCGMSDTVKAHLFEPFFTTKQDGCGTGLGLATVYGIVKQNHGDILVDSQVGVGTTFRVFLPRVDAPVAVAPATSPDPAAAAAAASCNAVILLVDDETAVLSMIRRLLEGAGHCVHAANGDDAALQAWQQHAARIDLLITDVIMPGMSGVELAARCHRDRPDLPVIYISAYTDAVLVEAGAPRGPRHFLQKPFAPDELLRLLADVLARRHPGGAGVDGAASAAVVGAGVQTRKET